MLFQNSVNKRQKKLSYGGTQKWIKKSGVYIKWSLSVIYSLRSRRFAFRAARGAHSGYPAGLPGLHSVRRCRNSHRYFFGFVQTCTTTATAWSLFLSWISWPISSSCTEPRLTSCTASTSAHISGAGRLLGSAAPHSPELAPVGHCSRKPLHLSRMRNTVQHGVAASAAFQAEGKWHWDTYSDPPGIMLHLSSWLHLFHQHSFTCKTLLVITDCSKRKEKKFQTCKIDIYTNFNHFQFSRELG